MHGAHRGTAWAPHYCIMRGSGGKRGVTLHHASVIIKHFITWRSIITDGVQGSEDILHLDDEPASALCVWPVRFMQQLLRMTLFGWKPVSHADFGQRLIHFWPSKELKLIWPRCSIIYFLLASTFDSLGMKLNKAAADRTNLPWITHTASPKSPCAD